MPWLRPHTPPRHVTRGAELGGLGRLSARGQWYYDRSRERWERRPDAQELMAKVGAAFDKGEIGSYENIRIIFSAEIHENPRELPKFTKEKPE